MDKLDLLVEKKLLHMDKRPIPLAGPLKVVRSVMAQQYCHNGMRYDIAVSWLQKAIRRGRENDAMHCAYQIAKVGKMFCNHLLNRLITILSEDIGPAEIGLVPVVKALYYRGLIIVGLHGDACLAELGPVVMTIIHLLCLARKTRITDWLIHKATELITNAHIADDLTYDPETPSFTDMSEVQLIEWMVTVRNTYTNGSTVDPDADIDKSGAAQKKATLLLQSLWKFLLSHRDTTDIRISTDMKVLYDIYQHRSVLYGDLFLAHAIVLFCRCRHRELTVCNEELQMLYKSLGSLSRLELRADILLPYTETDWEQLAELNPPIMTSAVDMHTLYGRKHLGRDMYDFVMYGSKLQEEKWTPFDGEREYLLELKQKHLRAVDHSQPRSYQNSLVGETVQYLWTHQFGWLVMACGSGKTKTSFWVTNGLTADSTEDYIVLVVAPFLTILRQFFQVWALLNRGLKKHAYTGIAASSRDTFRMDDYTGYEYLSESHEFLAFFERTGPKYLFTTYASLKKVRGQLQKYGHHPLVAIYDEAHHATVEHIVEATYSLFLSATPPGGVPVIGTYNLGRAITDGVLTDYRVRVFAPEMDPMGCLFYISSSNKRTIVYCRSNRDAEELLQEWVDYCGSYDDCYSISCHTPQKERESILAAFRRGSLKENGCVFLFNCRVLGEGVDIPECDSVFIVSGITAETPVMQAVGRGLRIDPSGQKKMAHVYMMSGKQVATRIKGLQKHDENVLSKIETIE